jgi:hypothetical protein
MSGLALRLLTAQPWPRGMSERTRRSHGGGNLPPPRMSELARMHLRLPVPCSRLCTPPVPVEVPVDVPQAAFPGTFQMGDMAVNRANVCPPTRENYSGAGRGNPSVFVRGYHSTAAGPAGSAHWPPSAGLRVSSHPCVECDERAHALRTPRWPHTRVCGVIRAGQNAHTTSTVRVQVGPYLAGTSRHGVPARSRHKIPLITCQ